MKQGIHPNYVDCTITCACGNVIKTRSTKPEIHVEVCSKCHPFYTGKQKLVDTGGRVDRFKPPLWPQVIFCSCYNRSSYGRAVFFYGCVREFTPVCLNLNTFASYSIVCFQTIERSICQ